jgi:pilus assembly protein CpaE
VVAATPVTIVKVLEYYPGDAELVRLMRSLSPQLVLLNADSVLDAVGVAKAVEAGAPGVPVVALGQPPRSGALLEMMRAGVREFLEAPFEATAVAEALTRVGEAAERVPRPIDLTEQVYTFLPSKAGVGTTTVAVNLSAALARQPGTRVLLADFDLNSGMTGFMLKLDNPYSVTSAAENCLLMDENLWRQLVSVRGSLEVLPAGKINPGFRIEPAQIRSLLDFARRQYKAICVDLSGNLEKYSVEIQHESKRIFLVCTAELPSLHLAREKLAFLRSIDLEDRVDVVLNRATRRDVVTPEEVEKLLGRPIRFTFPNDYKGIHHALASGQPAAPESELGKRFSRAAEELLSKGTPEEASRRKFVEYFSLAPGRYTLLSSGKKSA